MNASWKFYGRTLTVSYVTLLGSHSTYFLMKLSREPFIYSVWPWTVLQINLMKTDALLCKTYCIKKKQTKKSSNLPVRLSSRAWLQCDDVCMSKDSNQVNHHSRLHLHLLLVSIHSFHSFFLIIFYLFFLYLEG